jgi:hypothetical protein
MFVTTTLGWCYRERVILSVESGKCSLTVEADDQSHNVRLRVHPEGVDCRIAREFMLSVLQAASSKTDESKIEEAYSSLCIGRLIDYPWLSRSIAETAYYDSSWSREKGRPKKKAINKYTADLLFNNQITADIVEALGVGYQVVSVTVEKVCVGGFRHVPGLEGDVRPGKVPLDAIVWFRLRKK